MYYHFRMSKWQWEIVYEDSDDGQLGSLPLIHVPPEEKIPTFLMLWEARDTGELEPGSEGEDLPVVDWNLCQYAHMEVLKEKLSSEDYDKVRLALGLQPLKQATKEGKRITENVREAVMKRELEAKKSKM